MKNLDYSKLAESHRILYSCFGDHGVWADPSRYRRQCWTRDFGIAILPTLIEIGSPKAMGMARVHLDSMRAQQEPSGQIPILFLDGWKGHAKFLADKTRRTIRDGEMSFMLKRYIDNSGSLANLTPGTTDSELHYIVACLDYADATRMKLSHSVYTALHYVEDTYMFDGLHHGADWRDTMEVELMHTPLLSNNSILYGIYRRLGFIEKAKELRMRMNETFWTRKTSGKNTLRDRPNDDRFDPFGASLAVLNGQVSPEDYSSVMGGFQSVDSPRGVTIKCRHNHLDAKEKEVINRTDGVVVWPFVVGYSILAMRKMDRFVSAHEQYDKLLALKGFREWYDPADSQGYGAMEQLWSATLTARAIKVMQE